MTFGILGNSLVIYVTTAHRRMRTPTNMLLLNLAVIDLLYIVINILYLLTSVIGVLPENKPVCKMAELSRLFGGPLTAYTLLLVSIVRYIVVVHPHRATTLVRTKTVGALIAAIWLAISVISVSVQICFPCAYQVPPPSDTLRLYHYSIFVYAYVIPLTLITVFSVLTFRKLREPSFAASKKSDDNKRRASRMMAIVCAAFAVSLLLRHLVFIAPLYDHVTFNTFSTIAAFSIFLHFSNSCINPILYSFASQEFRAHFRNAICCCCRQSRPSPTTRAGSLMTSTVFFRKSSSNTMLITIPSRRYSDL